MRLTKKHFEFIADTVGPVVGWPSQLHELADKLAETNPRFDKNKFLRRATQAWEDNNLEDIEDQVPY